MGWSNRWLLKFNADKCHVLTLGKHENIVHAHNYRMDGVELEHVFEEKDLGVILDSYLTFDEHITAKEGQESKCNGSDDQKKLHIFGIELFQEVLCDFCGGTS